MFLACSLVPNEAGQNQTKGTRPVQVAHSTHASAPPVGPSASVESRFFLHSSPVQVSAVVDAGAEAIPFSSREAA